MLKSKALINYQVNQPAMLSRLLSKYLLLYTIIFTLELFLQHTISHYLELEFQNSSGKRDFFLSDFSKVAMAELLLTS